MPAISPSNRPYSQRIVPAWLWPRTPAAAVAAAEGLAAARPVAEQKANDYRVAAEQLSELTAGEMSEAMVAAHQRLAVDHANHASILDDLHAAAIYVGDLGNRLAMALDSIDSQAHQQISASTPETRERIIDAYHAIAVTAHQDFTETLRSYYTFVSGRVNPTAAAVIGRTPPTSPPGDPTTHALSNDPQHRGEKSDDIAPGSGGRDAESGSEVTASIASGSAPGDPRRRGDLSNGPIEAPSLPAPSATPLSPSVGGLTGVGGGLPGGLSGLGGGNALSSLASGAGQVPSGSPAGLGGLPAGAGGVPNAAAQAAQVGQPFASVLAAGASAGSAVPPLPPSSNAAAPPIEAGALQPPPASAAPASATAPGGIAAPGAHSPVSAVGSPQGSLSASAAAPPSMMLPSPGMGAPAAFGSLSGIAPGVSGSGSAATVPGGSTAPPASPAGASASAGPTLVPASVVAAGAARAERPVSPDVAAVNALAWELQAACDKRGYPLSWAVGVFRSPAGSETVVMSNDGSGYVPPGVALPRMVRLLTADPLVDKAFRDRWFGWADPARVLVEYAGLRTPTEWKLVAAAANDSVAAFRGAGAEYDEPCKRERCPLATDWSPPPLDELHVHRLQLEYPDLYDRLQSLAEAEPNLQERVILPISGRLVDSAKSAVDVEVPPILRAVWTTLTTGNEPTPAVWEKYDAENAVFAVLPAAHRPGGFENGAQQPEDVPSSNGEFYRNQWFVARTLEHIGGWSTRPLPLADMTYAAAAIGTADIAQQLEPSLREIENEFRRP
jgi:hypothetical protein